MKITTERRIRLAEKRLAREQAKLDQLRTEAASEDREEAFTLTPEPDPPAKPKSMVGAIIEARFLQPFAGDLYVSMFVVEDREDSFAAQCLRGRTLPDGSTHGAFLKSMKGQTWR
jgi:hypothetical protein